MTSIKTFEFKKESLNEIHDNKYGLNWPVVYVLNNNTDVYIGETSNAFQRMKNNLSNEERQKLDKINIIYDDQFNKSAVLDIEAQLIQYFEADKKYKLQNMKLGQSQSQDYYQRYMYINKVEEIWELLKRKHLADNPLDVLKNSDLFKYSPYKTLTNDQYQTAVDIIDALVENLDKEEKSFFVKGAAGTGKTILAIYLVKLLNDCRTLNIDTSDIENDDDSLKYYEEIGNITSFEFAFVVPMTALRNTLKKVFKSVAGLKGSMIIEPNDVVKKHYDLLIVDEAYRLTARRGITNYNSYDKVNKKLGLSSD